MSKRNTTPKPIIKAELRYRKDTREMELCIVAVWHENTEQQTSNKLGTIEKTDGGFAFRPATEHISYSPAALHLAMDAIHWCTTTFKKEGAFN